MPIRALSFSPHRNVSLPPPSPTFSDATNVSTMQFGRATEGGVGPSKIITRSNLKMSVQAYEDLLSSCSAYRTALLSMSRATAAFADAMQRCSGLKGPNYESGTRLQAASGVHHLMGNLWHVLAESLDKGFEKPLRQHLDAYKSTVHERSQDYERSLQEKSRIIRATEMRSMNRKERNLQSFREGLAVLQRQVDDLDELKLTHYQQIVEHEEDVWNVVQGKVCLVMRSSMDIFDRFTAKASDPVIEPMLQSVPDAFDAYGPPQAEDQIFSILSPLSITMNMNSTLTASSSSVDLRGSNTSNATKISSSSSPVIITPERGLVDRSKISSWLPGTNGVSVHAYEPSEVSEWAARSPHSSSSSLSSSSLVGHFGVLTYNNNDNDNYPRSRKYSAPAAPASTTTTPTKTIRKAESQLRSVLAVLEDDNNKTVRARSSKQQQQQRLERNETQRSPTDQVLEGFQFQPSRADDHDDQPGHHPGKESSSILFPSSSSSPTTPPESYTPLASESRTRTPTIPSLSPLTSSSRFVVPPPELEDPNLLLNGTTRSDSQVWLGEQVV